MFPYMMPMPMPMPSYGGGYARKSYKRKYSKKCYGKYKYSKSKHKCVKKTKKSCPKGSHHFKFLGKSSACLEMSEAQAEAERKGFHEAKKTLLKKYAHVKRGSHCSCSSKSKHVMSSVNGEGHEHKHHASKLAEELKHAEHSLEHGAKRLFSEVEHAGTDAMEMAAFA